MLENGFYKVKQEYIDLIREVGGIYKDAKERPIYGCVENRYIKGLYWAIPTSDLSHRSIEQIEKIEKIEKWCSLNERDIRWSYYYIGHTNRPALYRISSCFPITEKYVEGPYTSNGHHLVLQRKKDIEIIRKKLSRILLTENRTPNKFEQCITSIKNRLIQELS